MDDKQNAVSKLQSTDNNDIMYLQHCGKIGDEDAAFVKLLYARADSKIESCD